MADKSFDLVVIGAGPGGYVAAIRAAQLGWSVACIEKEPALGGTCLRVGCIPSKALLESSEQFHNAQHGLKAHGILVNQVQLDLAAMLKRKTQIVTTLTKGIEALFKKNKVTRFSGHATLLGTSRILVKGEKESTEISAKQILIATGSRSAPLPGVVLDGDRVGTSTEALSYPEVPKHLVVIGAGVIGLELGSVWNRLGSKVTVLEYCDRILPGMDTELATDARKLFEKQGLIFKLGAKVTSAKANGTQVVVEAQGQEPITCDRVLLAVGRSPQHRRIGAGGRGYSARCERTNPRGCPFPNHRRGHLCHR
jgi:dihydrolipoamide dehydrogenase